MIPLLFFRFCRIVFLFIANCSSIRKLPVFVVFLRTFYFWNLSDNGNADQLVNIFRKINRCIGECFQDNDHGSNNHANHNRNRGIKCCSRRCFFRCNFRMIYDLDTTRFGNANDFSWSYTGKGFRYFAGEVRIG